MIPSYDPNDTEAGLKLLEDLTTNAEAIQQQVLHQILSQNSGTQYLRAFLDGEADKNQQSFKNKVPVVNYDDVKPFIQRIADGESSDIVSAQPITELLTSSGTSAGKPKLMPSTAEELERKTFFYSMLVPIMNKYVDGLDEGKGMYLLFIKPEIKTPSGLMARPVLTSYYKSQHFRNRPFNKYNVYTSPDQTILCQDSKQSMYCQLLCGLVQRSHVLRVGAVFASAFLRAVKFLEDHYKELCADIRTGTVTSWITDSSCRDSVLSILNGPNQELADEIESECAEKSWEGILRRIWPKAKYVEVIVTGSMAQYIPTLEFYSGGLPLVSTMYASSECYFGINLNPLCDPADVSYTLLPNMAYFEFLPVDDKSHEEIHFATHSNTDDDDDALKEDLIVNLVNVEVGQYYEIVITTFTGQ
jgi:auxin responsive GH3 family protein